MQPAQKAWNWAPLSKGKLLLCSPSFSLLSQPNAVLGQEYFGGCCLRISRGCKKQPVCRCSCKWPYRVQLICPFTWH